MSNENEVEGADRQRWSHPDGDFFLIDAEGWAVPFEHFTERAPALRSRRRRVGRRTSVPRWAAAIAGSVVLAIAPSSVVLGDDHGQGEPPVAEESPTAAESVAAGDVVIGVYGDSYTAGEGVGTYLDATDQRHQSPHAGSVVAGALIEQANPGLEVTVPFAASSGAVTADVHTPQDRYDRSGNSNSPQLGQVPADVDAVVVGLGGNDARFAGIMERAGRHGHDLDEMRAEIARILRDDPPVNLDPNISAEEIQAQIDAARASGVGSQPANLAARLAMTYQDIRAQHPDAAMVVTNYPVAVDVDTPIDAGPGGLFGFNTNELAAIEEFAGQLNDQIGKAVENCGCDAALADVSGAFEGREAGTDDSYIVHPDHDSDRATHRPNERLHPTAAGQTQLGSIIAETIANELGVEPPAAAPAPGSIVDTSGVDMRSSESPDLPPPTRGRQPPVPASEWPGQESTEIEAPPSHPDLPIEDVDADDVVEDGDGDGDSDGDREADGEQDGEADEPGSDAPNGGESGSDEPAAGEEDDGGVPDPTDISFDPAEEPGSPAGQPDDSDVEEDEGEPAPTVVIVVPPGDAPDETGETGDGEDPAESPGAAPGEAADGAGGSTGAVPDGGDDTEPGGSADPDDAVRPDEPEVDDDDDTEDDGSEDGEGEGGADGGVGTVPPPDDAVRPEEPAQPDDDDGGSDDDDESSDDEPADDETGDDPSGLTPSIVVDVDDDVPEPPTDGESNDDWDGPPPEVDDVPPEQPEPPSQDTAPEVAGSSDDPPTSSTPAQPSSPEVDEPPSAPGSDAPPSVDATPPSQPSAPDVDESPSPPSADDRPSTPSAPSQPAPPSPPDPPPSVPESSGGSSGDDEPPSPTPSPHSEPEPEPEPSWDPGGWDWGDDGTGGWGDTDWGEPASEPEPDPEPEPEPEPPSPTPSPHPEPEPEPEPSWDPGGWDWGDDGTGGWGDTDWGDPDDDGDWYAV